jgi:NADP-dependent 3-hydroxy acid dehydrogenase YdfG
MKKIIFITGASAGIGKSMATYLADKGVTIYAAARRVEKMQDLAALGIHVLSLDVTDENSMVAAVNHIIEKEGRIDVLINNAGFGSYGALEDVPIADARYQLEVNVFGAARSPYEGTTCWKDHQYFLYWRESVLAPGCLVSCQQICPGGHQ